LINEWAILPTISASMPFQMALDEVLFQRAKIDGPEPCGTNLPKPVLRFYFSAGPWITVGYSEKNRDVPTNGTRICCRITGGGRVIHGLDIIFSLIAFKEHAESFKSVRLCYLKIHEAVKAGLESLGQSPRFYRCDENLPKGPDCFRFPIATDLGLGQRKIAGGAPKRSGRALLHQESVKLIAGTDPEELIQAICRGVEKIFCVRLVAADLDPELIREAGELSRERYEFKTDIDKIAINCRGEVSPPRAG
jgi:lipoate-protein ligase A